MFHCLAFGGKKLIGEHVYLKHWYTSGILRFIGKLHFDEKIHCGIELDEPIGENDGTVKGVRYFTCKPKCGLFLPANEVSLAYCEDVGIDLNIYDFITEDFIQPHDRVLDQNTSFKIKLPVINKENLDPMYAHLSCFEKIEDINECKNNSIEQNKPSLNSPFDQDMGKVENFEESEDSLGIIPHLLNLSSEDANLECDISYQLSELALSPVRFEANILFSKNGENSAPKYASTPKHELNTSYVIEESTKEENYIIAENPNSDILTKEICLENIQNDSIHSECNSKIIEFISGTFEQGKECIFSEDRNALNKTCCILKPTNSNITVSELEQEKECIFSEDRNALNITCCILKPTNSSITVSELEREKECIYSEDGNALNKTCILKPTNSSIAVSELNSLNNTKNVPINVLNMTISYPTADGKSLIEENVDKHLNTTFKITEQSLETDDRIEEDQLLSKKKLSLSADKSLNAYKVKSSRNLSISRIPDSSIPSNVKSKPVKSFELCKSRSGIPVKMESKLSSSSLRKCTKSVQNVPSPPEGPLKVFDIQTDSCTLRWNPSREGGSMPVKYYAIETQDGKARGGWKEVAKTKDTTFKYENLIPKKEYKFRIKAVNEIGSSKPLIASKTIFAKNTHGKTSLIPKRSFQKKLT